MGCNLSFWNTECSTEEEVSERFVSVDVYFPNLASFGWTKYNKEITKAVDTYWLFMVYMTLMVYTLLWASSVSLSCTI